MALHYGAPITGDTMTTDTDITLQIATAADAVGISPLFDAYRQFYGCSSDIAAAEAWLTHNLAEAKSTIMVARDGSDLVAFAQLYAALCSVDLVSYQILYDLYVTPTYRCRGVAASLLTATAQWAKAQGAARIDLETARYNRHAQRLYRKFGYARDEIFVKFSLDLGNWSDDKALTTNW